MTCNYCKLKPEQNCLLNISQIKSELGTLK